jgi:hypothetical protein
VSLNETVCIVIGVSEYEDTDLQQLPGAVVDARGFFEAATGDETGVCDPGKSSLLLNPTVQKVRDAIAEYIYESATTNLTIFFAGHGGETKSGYYLACADSEARKLAYSGFSLTDLFQMLNESDSIHVNVIVDACEAGGFAVDIPAISKSFEMGVAGGLSISLLALSSRNQSAGEAIDGSGGFGTKALLNTMLGSIDTGTNKSELSLADVAQLVEIQGGSQIASFWSFNLQGAPAFCRNCYAIRHRSAEVFEPPVQGVPASSNLTQDQKEKLWLCYLQLSKQVQPRKLYSVLSDILGDLEDNTVASSVLSGLFESFSHKTRESDDAFAPVILTSVFSMVAADIYKVEALCEYFLRVLAEQLASTLSELATDMESDTLFLLRGAGGYSEFFSLPQRVTLIAAWALSAVRIHEVVGFEPESVQRSMRKILACLSRDYAGSFELISEKQAPCIVVISGLCAAYAEGDWAENHIGCLYHSYFNRSGKVAKNDLPSKEVFSFLRHRLSDEDANFEKYCNRPSEAFFALLAHYWVSKELDIIRYDLSEIDGTVVGTFVPESYRGYSGEIISKGSNLYFQFGFEVFTIAELAEFFEQHLMPRVDHASQELNQLQSSVALIASLVFPDRVPWHIIEQVS